MRMVIPPIALALVWSQSAGMRKQGRQWGGHSDAEVSDLCCEGERMADASRSEEARRRRKGCLFAQPQRWWTDQSSSDGSHMLERSRGSLG